MNFITKIYIEYRLLVCSFSLASITDVMSIFRRQFSKDFFRCFGSKVSAYYLTVKCRVLLTLISSALRNLTALLYQWSCSISWRLAEGYRSKDRRHPWAYVTQEGFYFTFAINK